MENYKLYPDEIKRLRELRKKGVKYQSLANFFGINVSNAYKIANKQTYKWNT